MSRTTKNAALALLALLATAIAAAPASAETYTVTWDAVTTYSDGAALGAGKSVSYSVYWTTDPSLSAASLKPIATATSSLNATFDPTVAGMTRGNTVYFTMKASLGAGQDSGLASVVSWPVPRKAPGAPGATKIIKLKI